MKCETHSLLDKLFHDKVAKRTHKKVASAASIDAFT